MHSFKQRMILRKMSFVGDQEGIMSRYIRERENWDKHLKRCHQYILKSAETKEKGKAVILGSGWLLDLPYEDLSKMFDSLILIDIRHPRQIRNRLQSFNNIEFVEADLTGGVIWDLYKHTKKKPYRKERPLLTVYDRYKFELPSDADFVVSLNILNQLNILLADFLMQKRNYRPADLKGFEASIQRNHLSILPSGKSCLIADYEEELIDEEGNLSGVKPLIFIDLPDGRNILEWKWIFDTRYTYYDDFKIRLNVRAMEL